VQKREHQAGPPDDLGADQRDRLQEIAEHLRLKTAADGAAIAIEGNDAAVTCRASAGDCAPSIGVVLDPQSGISGLCLRSGEIVCCDDTASDLRVNAEVIGITGILSILAVPLRCEGRVVGVVEVLSRTRNAFAGMEEETSRAAAIVLDVVGEKFTAADATYNGSLQLVPNGEDAEISASGLSPVEEVQASDGAAIEYSILDPMAAVVALAEATSAITVPGRVANAASAGNDIAVPTFASEHATVDGALDSEAKSAARMRRARLLGVLTIAVLGIAGVGLLRLAASHTAPHPSLALSTPSDAKWSRIDNLRQTALAGDARAQYELAMRYLRGDGLARSESDAITWLLKSAHQGNGSAQYQLGIAYERGTAIPQDYVKAYACYVMAGINGNRESDQAQTGLAPRLSDEDMATVRRLVGQMLKNGVGTAADKVKAYVWFTLAEEAGSREGRQEKQSLASRMSRSQIATADKQVAEWLQRHNEER
jgi:TPR repeat protein